MDSNANPLSTDENSNSWKSRRNVQRSHRHPGHHPIDNEATIITIRESVRDRKAVKSTHYRPNGTPKARLNKEYTSCKHHDVGLRKALESFTHGDEEVEYERPEQAHQN